MQLLMCLTINLSGYFCWPQASTTAEFVLTVADGDQSATTYRKVITVTDVNDVQPKFSQLRYKTHLREVGTLYNYSSVKQCHLLLIIMKFI